MIDPDALPLATVKVLASLLCGGEFYVDQNDAMAVRLPTGVYPVTGGQLADLQARALIRFGEDDPESNLPRTVTVTEWGRTFLNRYCLAHGLRIEFYQVGAS